LHLPYAVLLEFMEVGPTLLAVVVFWCHSIIHDTYAAPMLPHAALIALYEKRAGILGEVSGTFLQNRKARIILILAYAASDLVIFDDFIFHVIFLLCDFLFMILLPLAASCLR